MLKIPAGMTLPRNLDDIDAAFMTRLLRARGLLDEGNEVLTTVDADVGMTAGYFSAIKRVKCRFARPTAAPDAFVVKTWPDFENAPKAQIASMFERDIIGYSMPESRFYPRPKVYLADFDADSDRWALVMDDASAFGQQKLHETEMTFDEVMHMIPKLVEVAMAWEGCHEGERAAELDRIGVSHWASPENLATFEQIMPAGAPIFDAVTDMPQSSLVAGKPWSDAVGHGTAVLFTNKIEAFYDAITPGRGATCTLVHGDLRGDNLFFCPATSDYPAGWLTIDFQLMTRGPIPSDLAYLMNSGSVLPEVYRGANRDRVLRTFFEAFMDRTRRYKDYDWDRFRHEYSVMATVLFVYFVGFGANIWQAGVNNELPARVELGGQGVSEDALAPEELRQRMWWRKAIANFEATFRDFDLYAHLLALPHNTGAMGSWSVLPDRLKG